MTHFALLEKNTLPAAFAEVIKINNLVGNTAKPCRETLKHQLDIIRSELDELNEGYEAADNHEFVDGIGDVLFTLAGLYGRMGFTVPDRFNPVPITDMRELLMLANRSFGGIEALSDVAFSSVYVAITALLQQTVEYIDELARLGGWDSFEILNAVIASNWTKFDRSESDAKRTALKYEAAGIAVEQKVQVIDGEDAYIVTYSATDQPDQKGKPMRKGKWLKSVNFQDTQFNL